MRHQQAADHEEYIDAEGAEGGKTRAELGQRLAARASDDRVLVGKHDHRRGEPSDKIEVIVATGRANGEAPIPLPSAQDTAPGQCQAPFPVRFPIRCARLLRRGRARLARGRYAARIAAEVSRFRDDTDVHALPPIFHYWSNRYLRPKLESHGFSHPDAFFVANIEACCARSAASIGLGRRIISLGAGNCDTEVRLARALVDAGRSDFVIECLDLNPAMLDRGRALAAEQGVAAHIAPVRGDFNVWQPDNRTIASSPTSRCITCMALERLFDCR